jgi:hypothetical protein
MSEIANKGRVRIWTVRPANCQRTGDLGPVIETFMRADGPRVNYGEEPVEAAALPDLKNLLTELADEYETHAATWDEVAQSREGQDKLFAAGMARGRSLIFEEAASELRHLITEQLGEER